MPRALLIALVIALLAAAPARAEYEGTPGKVAYMDGFNPMALKVWDPAKDETTTLEDQTYRQSTSTTLSLGLPSPPAWSPDGTRLAYAKSVDGTGNNPTPVLKTQLYVYDLRTGETTQLTHPADVLADLTPDDDKFVGHGHRLLADVSPDGQTVAFIRQITGWTGEPPVAGMVQTL